MPYPKNSDLPKSVRDALPEAAQVIYRNAHNSAGKLYGYKNEVRLSKIAWAAVKRDYEQDKDKKWVEKKGINAARASGTKRSKYEVDDWVPIGQPEQIAVGNNTKKVHKIGLDAFKAAEGTWTGGRISINHGDSWNGHSILDEKFDGELLYAKFDEEVINELNSPSCTGGSIEALDFVYDAEGVVTNMVGTGFSLTYRGANPLCTPEMGCAGIVASVTSFEKPDDIPTYKNASIEGGLETAAEEIKSSDHVKSQIGGDRKNMGDKEVDKTVTYTSEQLGERIVAAVAEVTEAKDNERIAALGKQKEESDKEAETLKTETETKFEEATKEAFALANRRAEFIRIYGVPEDSEIIKKWDEAKTPGDMQDLVNSMEYVPGQTAGISAGVPAPKKSESEIKLEEAVTKLGTKYKGGGT